MPVDINRTLKGALKQLNLEKGRIGARSRRSRAPWRGPIAGDEPTAVQLAGLESAGG